LVTLFQRRLPPKENRVEEQAEELLARTSAIWLDLAKVDVK
jgi:hypothetical protein